GPEVRVSRPTAMDPVRIDPSARPMERARVGVMSAPVIPLTPFVPKSRFPVIGSLLISWQGRGHEAVDPRYCFNCGPCIRGANPDQERPGSGGRCHREPDGHLMQIFDPVFRLALKAGDLCFREGHGDGRDLYHPAGITAGFDLPEKTLPCDHVREFPEM